MKINVSIDATAQEAREFLGLPDVKPLQDEMLEAIRNNMQQGTSGFDPMSLMKPLFPAQMQSMDRLQKAFWNAFQQNGNEARTEPGSKNNPKSGT